MLRAVGVALCLGVIVRSAWLCDDALISFRTIEHFVQGEGLRFNLAERVQGFTHPLWLFVLSAVYSLTREAFYTPIAVSLGVSAAALGVLAWRLAPSSRAAWAGLACLASSKSFVDHAVSGLETPLTALLLAGFLGLFWFRAPGEGRCFGLAFSTGLLGLCRLDALLLVLPAVAGEGWRVWRTEGGRWRWLALAVLGALPLLGWLGFSLLYYGSFLPNTALAKLATGIPSLDLARQGGLYLLDALRRDPVTLLLIGAALVAACAARERALRPVAGGIALYVAYTVWIGGDFMAGRFLAVPLFAAVALLVRALPQRRVLPVVAVGSLALSLILPSSPLRADADYEVRDKPHGIADERGAYYPQWGLLSATRRAVPSAGSQCEPGGPRVYVKRHCGALGVQGFGECPDRHIVDRCALVDPLLARLTLIDTADWRVGHYRRLMPAGYRESLERDVNAVRHPAIRALYADVRRATRDPLFSWDRLGAIYRLHFHDYGIVRRAPPRRLDRPD